jgi:hypothetical protein
VNPKLRPLDAAPAVPDDPLPPEGSIVSTSPPSPRDESPITAYEERLEHWLIERERRERYVAALAAVSAPEVDPPTLPRKAGSTTSSDAAQEPPS